MASKSAPDPQPTPPISPARPPREDRVDRPTPERVGALATLAAGVAHEINNPLGYLRANLEFIQAELAQIPGLNPELFAALADALHGTERISAAVQAVSLFGLQDSGGIGPTSVNRLVDTALRLAWPQLGRQATIQKELGEVPEVMANEARLAQVVFQLMVHAADALGDLDAPHSIWVRTRFEAPTNEVVIEVEDDGPGMSAYEARRAFDPAASVNTRGDGGIGLPLCYRLVGSMGGGMSLITNLGAGRKVRVHLPAVTATVRPA